MSEQPINPENVCSDLKIMSDDPSHKLELMLMHQLSLQDHFQYKLHHISPQDRTKKTREMVEAISNELQEVVNRIPWKPWRKYKSSDHQLSEKEILELQYEIIDIWHFIMNLCLLWNISAKDFYNLYMAKNKENMDRIQRGYAKGKKLKSWSIIGEGNFFKNLIQQLRKQIGKDKDNRMSIEEIYMRMAENLALRSTCNRTMVGCVITTSNYEQVLSIGYNGNAKGLNNRCDSLEPGMCGCIHAEANALIKAGSHVKDKVLFVTMNPCKSCAKLIVNSGFSKVYYRTPYRLTDGIDLLKQCGIGCTQLPKT